MNESYYIPGGVGWATVEGLSPEDKEYFKVRGGNMMNNAHNVTVSSNINGGTAIYESKLNGGIISSIWDNVNAKRNLKENEKMAALYQVTVVKRNKEIIVDKKVIASNQENAKFNSGLYNVLIQENLVPDDVSVIVNQLGFVTVEDNSN